jgi:hypothetical protein
MSTFTFDLESLKGSVGSFERGLSANTPDSKLTYSGNDPIVWDRVNNERLSRGLSPLPNPKPVDDGKKFNTGSRSAPPAANPSTDRPLTEAERAQAAAIARQFGLPDPVATAKTFEVSGPPNMTREQAFEIFQKQVSAGGLTGFQPGDIVSAQTQAADGLAEAQAELTQGFAGFPGTDKGVQNQFVSIAESAKQSLAAGNTGSLQSRITNGGTILQQTSAKISSLFGEPVTDGINTADFAKTAAAFMPMSGIGTTDVRATVASIGAATGQNFDQITNSVGVGKFGFDASQLETAGLLKPGTTATFLNQGSNNLTSVLKSPAVWTGAGGVTGLDSFLSNPKAQNLTQQNLMSSGLAAASALGLPTDLLGAGDVGGISAVFSKDTAEGAAWIKGVLPPNKQAEFDAKFNEAKFAVNTAEQKLNDAVLQQAPPGQSEDTVNRVTVDAAATRVVGNDKVPEVQYSKSPLDTRILVFNVDSAADKVIQQTFVLTETRAAVRASTAAQGISILTTSESIITEVKSALLRYEREAIAINRETPGAADAILAKIVTLKDEAFDLLVKIKQTIDKLKTLLT